MPLHAPLVATALGLIAALAVLSAHQPASAQVWAEPVGVDDEEARTLLCEHLHRIQRRIVPRTDAVTCEMSTEAAVNDLVTPEVAALLYAIDAATLGDGAWEAAVEQCVQRGEVACEPVFVLGARTIVGEPPEQAHAWFEGLCEAGSLRACMAWSVLHVDLLPLDDPRRCEPRTLANTGCGHVLVASDGRPAQGTLDAAAEQCGAGNGATCAVLEHLCAEGPLEPSDCAPLEPTYATAMDRAMGACVAYQSPLMVQDMCEGAVILADLAAAGGSDERALAFRRWASTDWCGVWTSSHEPVGAMANLPVRSASFTRPSRLLFLEMRGYFPDALLPDDVRRREDLRRIARGEDE